MSELNSTNAWPFTEISAEEGLDINAIFGDSTDTANQGNPFEAQAAAAAPAPAPATQEMPAAPAVEAAAPMPAVAPPKEAPAPAQPESNAAAGNPIAAAFEQKTAENTKKGLLEKPPVFYHKGVKEDIEDASMTFEELRIRKSEDFTDLEEGKRVSWSVEYCGIRKEIKDPKGTTIISMKETIERSREFLEALKKSKEKDPCCYVKPKVEMKTKGNAAYKGRFGTLEEARESDRDECSTGLYLVLGRLDHFYPEIKARIFCGDSFVPIDPDTVVEGLERQFPREWLEQVSIRRKESVRVEKKRGFMDRLAEVKW